MPKVSAKRQITLPASQCRIVGIEPGDEYRSFIYGKRITIVRREPGDAWGCLKHLRADEAVSEEQSRQDAIERRRPIVR